MEVSPETDPKTRLSSSPVDRPDQRLDPGFSKALLEVEGSDRVPCHRIDHASPS
jgi:hypothetical protein